MALYVYFLLTLAVLLPGFRGGDAAAQQLPLHYLGQQEGLGNLSVNALEQDASGYLWVGTDNGLFRYNGKQFQRYAQAEGMVGTQVTALLADRLARLWVGTADGAYLLRGRRLLPLRAAGAALPVDTGQSLTPGPQGKLLLVSSGRLYEADPQPDAAGYVNARAVFSKVERQALPQLDQLAGVLAEADGDVWMGCGVALCVRNRRGVVVWGVAAGVPEDRWLNLRRGSDGSLWARGQHHVIVLSPGGHRFHERSPRANVMRKVAVATALVEDGDHRMLINTDQGLARWHAGGWQYFGGANGLRMGGGVPAMLVDRDHGLWLGTAGHGLVRWKGYDNWENWGAPQGLPDDHVFAFLRDRAGRLRIGTRSGMAMLAGGAAARAVPVPGYRHEQWNSMVKDRRGNLWSSSYTGSLVREDAASGQVRQVATLDMIFGLLADRQGRIWISSATGLYVLDPAAAAPVARRPAGLPAGSALLSELTRRSCQGLDGTLWFLTGAQLWRLREGRWQDYLLRRHNEPEFDMLACSADGSVWLGQGSAGLWRASVTAGGLVKRALSSAALRDKVLLSMHEDRHGRLWLGTDAGLVLWDRKRWRQFDSSDGLAWNDINARPFYEEADGALWIATSNGASHIIHPERLLAPYPLSAMVEEVERDGRAVRLGDGDALPWSAGALHLTIASLSYQHRDALRFRYRLAGLETDWTISASPTPRYAALPPGDYRFEYQVLNQDTDSSSALAELRFTILPPWWRSLWFMLLCALLLVAGVGQLHRWRVRGLRQRAAQMELLVQARTRELELSQEALRERALRDGLTKAWNRAAVLEMLDQLIAKGPREGGAFLLCLMDLDFFKRINDNYGHLAGDAVLCQLVQRLMAGVRPYDLVGRYGGEEFLVLLTDVDGADGAARVEHLRRSIAAAPFDLGAQGPLKVTASVGVAVFDPSRPVAGLELVRRADLALYRAKALGRNRVEFACAEDAATDAPHPPSP